MHCHFLCPLLVHPVSISFFSLLPPLHRDGPGSIRARLRPGRLRRLHLHRQPPVPLPLSGQQQLPLVIRRLRSGQQDSNRGRELARKLLGDKMCPVHSKINSLERGLLWQTLCLWGGEWRRPCSPCQLKWLHQPWIQWHPLQLWPDHVPALAFGFERHLPWMEGAVV